MRHVLPAYQTSVGVWAQPIRRRCVVAYGERGY
jgi:hypothetical protein